MCNWSIIIIAYLKLMIWCNLYVYTPVKPSSQTRRYLSYLEMFSSSPPSPFPDPHKIMKLKFNSIVAGGYILDCFLIFFFFNWCWFWSILMNTLKRYINYCAGSYRLNTLVMYFYPNFQYLIMCVLYAFYDDWMTFPNVIYITQHRLLFQRRLILWRKCPYIKQLENLSCMGIPKQLKCRFKIERDWEIFKV